MRARNRRNGRRTRGMTLIEIMVVVMIIAMVASAVGVNVLGASDDARKQQATAETATLTQTAEAYLASHPNEPCPSVRDLMQANMLSNRSDDRDPWENPYAIDCDPGIVQARSAGPDGIFDNEDDIL
jgi:general secretion pathway protein G